MTDKTASHVLTRQLMREGGIEAFVSREAPDLLILSDQEREASLQATLAEKPAGPLWVFGYGSLIWNPTLRFEERMPVWIKGWHRSFCLSVTAGRGNPRQPGLVLALDHGGECSGVAYRLCDSEAVSELSLLWRREMLSGAYIPRWLPMFGNTSQTSDPVGHALAFTMDHAHQQYAGELTEEEVVHRLATAKGYLGSSAEYLFHTCEGLQQSGLSDESLETLASKVQQYQQTLKVR